jgi:hypothetical protein
MNAPVSVPDVVTGDPEIENTDVGSANATLVTVPIPDGRSALVIARNVGVAAPPETGPAKNVFAVSVFNENVKVPEDVMGEPLTVNIPGAANPTEVTVPDVGVEGWNVPRPELYAGTCPEA